MSNSHEELRGSYEDFLRSENFGQVDKIATAIDDYNANSMGKESNVNMGSSCPRVKINLTELRSENPRLEQGLRTDPLRHLRALEAACHIIALEERPEYEKYDVQTKVSIEGPLGTIPSTPRTLLSSSLRHLVCVEGVATKVSAIKPKLVKSVHYCPTTKKHQSRTYVDATDPNLGLPALDNTGRELPDTFVNVTSTIYPTKDAEKNPLETEFGLSSFKDYQTITVQEMPEHAPMGQLPRSLEFVVDHDLVDRVKPGDRVQIVGVFRALATSGINGQSSTSGVYKTVVLVNNIQVLGRDVSQLNFEMSDITMIKSLSKRKDLLTVLSQSIAPSIHGHEMIKKALILQLLSGCEKNLANGTHLRGDINILMVGDPSTAKSQLLRAVMIIAPLAISTTGKGSSGVGLTAAVTSDPDTRERRLEAGAMVMADRGIICVDEFDKMSESDRVAIHEAMEQQTVTIAKAGIHASLNARCAVLAAANPVYGQYDRKRRIQENIGLPDSLLSRFDLLFVVLDQIDPDTDRRIASHVIKAHQYRPPNGELAYNEYDEDDESSDDEINNSKKSNSIWQKSRYDGYSTSSQREILQTDFLRKYLHYAKTRMKPVLTEEAREHIAVSYAEMRNRQDERTLPVTARSLETIIRLASAHAKARLSPTVDADPDCVVAMDLLFFALYHDQKSAKEDANDSTDERDTDDDRVAKKSRTTEQPTRLPQNNDPDADLKRRIYSQLTKDNVEKLIVTDLFPDVQDRSLIKIAVDKLESEGKIFKDGDTIYNI